MTCDREIKAFTRAWCGKDDRIAAASYFGTFAVYFLTLWLAMTSAQAGLWLVVVPILVVNAFSAVRLYVLQHDTGHHSLFSTKRMNDLAGYGLSTFTLTPYRAMQYNHNMHHAYLVVFNDTATTEIYTMTLREWNAAGWWKRLTYRLYRNPAVMMALGGVLVYALRYRWPKNASRTGLGEIMAHNIAVLAWVMLIHAIWGGTGLAVYGATVVMAGAIGVFLVFLQHNFEDTYWDRRPDLNKAKAELVGSSCLDLGWWFDLGTGNIAYHDIHHFNPAIPSYRLRKCHKALRPHVDMHIIRWPEAIRSFGLKLWDEDRQKLVPFPPARVGAGVGAVGA